ncbi:hypothetical protein Ccrd_024786, partial [Cynara cardunculus var. scolymus]
KQKEGNYSNGSKERSQILLLISSIVKEANLKSVFVTPMSYELFRDMSKIVNGDFPAFADPILKHIRRASSRILKEKWVRSERIAMADYYEVSRSSVRVGSRLRRRESDTLRNCAQPFLISQSVVLNCSGRGDKDVHTAIKHLQVILKLNVNRFKSVKACAIKRCFVKGMH